MESATSPSCRRTIARLAADARGLELLVLHGSRARGEARSGADWDLAYLARPGFDPESLRADLVLALGTERIDLSNLAGASGLFRYRVARDGKVLFEDCAGVFETFWLAAVGFWCDVEPLLRVGYEEILAEYV